MVGKYIPAISSPPPWGRGNFCPQENGIWRRTSWKKKGKRGDFSGWPEYKPLWHGVAIKKPPLRKPAFISGYELDRRSLQLEYRLVPNFKELKTRLWSAGILVLQSLKTEWKGGGLSIKAAYIIRP